MSELKYCVKCTELGELCPKCQPLKRDIWRESIPERYRDANMSKCSIGFNTALQFVSNFIGKSRERSGLLVYGDMGIGKTYLVAAMCNKLIDMYPCKHGEATSPVIWMHDQEFVSECQWANAARGEYPLSDVVKHLAEKSRHKLLVIDDVGQGTPRLDVALTAYNYLIDQVYNKKGWLVIISNYSIENTKDYLGFYAVDRLIQLCGKEFMIKMKGESLRK